MSDFIVAAIPIPPGETLKEYLVNWNISQKELAMRLNLSHKHVNEIIKGKAPITIETAIKLEKVLGLPASFWLGLESTYQEAQARESLSEVTEKEIEILKSVDYAELARNKWVEKTNITARKIENLHSYFGVVSLESIPQLIPVAFRVSNSFTPSGFALAAWLRQGEVLAQEIKTEGYSKSRVKTLIKEIRILTTKPQEEYLDQLAKKCAKYGIALVIVPHLKKTYVSGAVTWVNSNRIILQLSTRGTYSDIFWFSLFHELGHIYHEHNKNKTIIYDPHKESTIEKEADDFASRNLIPEVKYQKFISNGVFSEDKIKVFANDIKIHPGIVVGRLAYDKLIKHGQFNDLREKILCRDNEESLLA
ncbi:MAG: HigA family addiction module antitoxin [Candidatus Cloacimonadales bacterium]